MKNKKELGQNWLKNRAILDEIADYAVAGADKQSAEKIAEKKELCVEIGPGLGFLTSSLLKRFERVIAVEFDSELAQKLPGSFPGKNLTVVNEDVLKYDFDMINEPYTVAGNIPYYITSPIIKKLLTLGRKPERIVLLVQKEVAERIVDKKETVLSLFVKNHAKVTAGLVVSKEEFAPAPKVDSQLIIMKPYEKPVVGEAVFDLILTAFKAPRKKLVHNLAGFGTKEELFIVLNECGVSMDARSGDVDLKQWAELYKKLQ